MNTPHVVNIYKTVAMSTFLYTWYYLYISVFSRVVNTDFFPPPAKSLTTKHLSTHTPATERNLFCPFSRCVFSTYVLPFINVNSSSTIIYFKLL